MAKPIEFDQAGRLPVPGDNVAIAVRRLEAGSSIAFEGEVLKLTHTVMEGHRFAVRPIEAGGKLLSWGLTFAEALRPIAPGEYICNAKILEVLRQRHVDFTLPEHENFKDYLVRYELNEAGIQPGTQVPLYDAPGTFLGFDRGPARGVGTRNTIIVLSTNSQTAGYARLLVERLKGAAEAFGNIDGIVAVTHTEGGSGARLNNLDFILRTLAGFMVHANVAAVLAVDFGFEAVTNASLEEFMRGQGYPLDEVKHHFLSISGGFSEALDEGERILRGWLEPVNAAARSLQPLKHLKLALQCGGSDAFSGISGNPLAAWIAKEVIRNGGSANLAETDELIGAERYVLENVRDLETARAFLEKIEIFKTRAGWHGQSVEGNPSGGNNFRGLYNIALKSIGAARKRDPQVRLDYVIDYGQRMDAPGYYFMDSPGNDLESIAGQVASGANMILFITGNGSITNFPFVPTIKIMTTSSRYELLSADMDINAGRYQDGMHMDELGRESCAYTLKVASGLRSIGEKAGHSQVSIWRDWQQNDGTQLEALRAAPHPRGNPLAVHGAAAASAPGFRAYATSDGFAGDRIGLIVPSSLCSGQIARQIAERLNALNRGEAVSRYVALVHTEGCGCAGGDSEQLLLRTLVGHLRHPFVRKGLLLEHGCEKTVNDYIRNFMQAGGVDPENFGWASVQMDGGIEAVSAKVADWFAEELSGGEKPERQEVDGSHLRVGLTAGGVSPRLAFALADFARAIVDAGGRVVVAENASLLQQPEFLESLLGSVRPAPTLAYGQVAEAPGLHIMETPTRHPVEVLSGLGATGVEVMLAAVQGPPLQGHPMIPLLQISADGGTIKRWGRELDAVFDDRADDRPEDEAGGPEQISMRLLDLLARTASGEYTPKLHGLGNTDFQLTRGQLGISM